MIKILFACILFSQTIFAQVPATPPTKRFDVTSADGQKFSMRADALPAKFPPEWGINPVIVTTDLTAQNAADAATQSAKDAALARVKTLPAGAKTPAQLSQGFDDLKTALGL